MRAWTRDLLVDPGESLVALRPVIAWPSEVRLAWKAGVSVVLEPNGVPSRAESVTSTLPTLSSAPHLLVGFVLRELMVGGLSKVIDMVASGRNSFQPHLSPSSSARSMKVTVACCLAAVASVLAASSTLKPTDAAGQPEKPLENAFSSSSAYGVGW